jgi:hypothetical protein
MVLSMSPPVAAQAGGAAQADGAAGKQAAAAEPSPPEGQTYIGTKACAACHFDQFMQWKKTKHAQAFDILTAKYQKDAKCLKCHTTGLGEPTGFKDKASTPNLVSVSCESCHGPGSKHEEVSKPFTAKKLTAQQEKVVRDSIWKMLPKNVCVDCHLVQGHHASMTPPEMRKKP